MHKEQEWEVVATLIMVILFCSMGFLPVPERPENEMKDLECATKYWNAQFEWIKHSIRVNMKAFGCVNINTFTLGLVYPETCEVFREKLEAEKGEERETVHFVEAFFSFFFEAFAETFIPQESVEELKILALEKILDVVNVIEILEFANDVLRVGMKPVVIIHNAGVRTIQKFIAILENSLPPEPEPSADEFYASMLNMTELPSKRILREAEEAISAERSRLERLKTETEKKIAEIWNGIEERKTQADADAVKQKFAENRMMKELENINQFVELAVWRILKDKKT